MTPASLRRASWVVCVAAALGAALVAVGKTAHAEGSTATMGLAAAEQAYQEVDFATMHEEATRALARGGATRDETARLYVLAGISSAALGEDEEAKRAFIVALGVDPTLKLDRNLSPKIRGPYLEAQGYWGAHLERLGLEARVATDGENLTIGLVDPAHLTARVTLQARAVGTTTYEGSGADAARVVRFSLPKDAPDRGLEYFAVALDAHQNVLAELGSEMDPRGAPAVAPTSARKSAVAEPQTSRPRSYLLPAALGAAGLVAAGVGVVFHVERESAAQEWNGPHCEQPGATRLQQCADVDSRRRFDQGMAIGAYSAAGLLLAGSAVALVLGRRPSAEAPPPSRTGLTSCAVAGPALTCVGRF